MPTKQKYEQKKEEGDVEVEEEEEEAKLNPPADKKLSKQAPKQESTSR